MGLRSRLRTALHGIVGVAPPLADTSSARAPVRSASPGATVAQAPVDVPSETSLGASDWSDLGPVGNLAEGRPVTRARPDGGSVVVFLHAGQAYAIDNACSHEDGPVGEGEVRGTCVRCPYHDWEFDFTTGDCRTDPQRPLATWSVAIRDARIRLGPQLRSGTPHRGGDHNDGMETIVQ